MRMGKRDLSDEQAARVLGFLDRRLRSVHGGVQSKLARELGMAQPSLWQLLNGETRPSLATADAIAKVENLSLETVLAGPRERAAALAREIGVPERAMRRGVHRSAGANGAAKSRVVSDTYPRTGVRARHLS